MKILTKVDFVYCFRIAAIGLIVSIVGLFLGGILENFFFLYLGLGFIFFSVFLLFSSIWLDSILGLNVANSILLYLFGVDVVRVTVQNIFGGNNLVFLVPISEKNKIPKFEDYKIDKIYSVKSSENNLRENKNLDDLEKIATLKDKGILTQEEFELKKKQILGL